MTTTAVRAAPASAWLLAFGVTLVAMFALQLSNLGFSPLLPSIQQDLGMSFTQLGLFTGMYGLLAMALSVPAGMSARRFGEKRVLAAGLLGVAAGSVLLGEAWNVESALTFRGLTSSAPGCSASSVRNCSEFCATPTSCASGPSCVLRGHTASMFREVPR